MRGAVRVGKCICFSCDGVRGREDELEAEAGMVKGAQACGSKGCCW